MLESDCCPVKIQTVADANQVAQLCCTIDGRRYSAAKIRMLVGQTVRFAVQFKDAGRWKPAARGKVQPWTSSGGLPSGTAYPTLAGAMACTKPGTPARIIIVASKADAYGNAVPLFCP